MASEWVQEYVRSVPDFPVTGQSFCDITPLLADAAAFGRAIDDLVSCFHDVGVDRVVGIESRGFIIAAPFAYRLRAGFIPVRRAGKLPWAVAREEYRFGDEAAKLEIHRDAIHPDEQVVVIDDVLATGATAAATCQLIETLGGRLVGLGFMLEVAGLGGRERLGDRRIEVMTGI
jgi:adenine phosphoribosyltransferase